MKKLSKIQQKILDFARKNDISKMTLTEMNKILKLDHLYKVQYHLEQLKKKNLIYIDSDRKTQKVTESKGFVVDNLLNVPILGSANCGPALEFADEQIQGYLKISKRLVNFSKPENLIALRAVGESLNKADINGDGVDDGDYLIVDCKKQPQNNDYVLSVIDGAANFKKFFKDNKKKEVRLISESTLNIAPIILHEEDLATSNYFVNGVVVRVVKN